MDTRTKIICTIGPAVSSLEKVIALIAAGMNIARLNFSHGSHEEHLRIINILKAAREQLGVPLAIMLDTKGPEIRLGKIKDNLLVLAPGHRWQLVKEDIEGDLERVRISPDYILDRLELGDRLLFDDGYIGARVVKVEEGSVTIETENGGTIRSGKGVNIPHANLSLPAITEKDIDDIRFGCEHDIDIIAVSFVRSPDHVLIIKKLLAEEKKSDIQVVAKIENSQGVDHFDSILQVADGIMIARGDLGVQVPLSEVPRLQKMMIRKCYLAGKPAVTATQMLESMINNPRPTRAEASDVANAIYDGTSAVMLSGETAVGKFPLETVAVMKSIVMEAEADFNYANLFDQHAKFTYNDVPSAVTLATVKTAYSSNAKAIFAFTNSGSTARLLSRLRPPMPIIAMTPSKKCYHQLSFSWGVVPFLSDVSKSFTEAFDAISVFALEKHYVSYGDLVVVTAGSPFGISGTTNTMIVESIGDVLVRAGLGWGHRIYGNVALVLSPDSRPAYTVKDHLLVIAKCDDTYFPLIQEASGVILQNHVDDDASEQYLLDIAREFDKPVIVRADAACRILKEGQLITLYPDKALVYKGVVL
jgi:pyruvate kinase